MKLDFVIFGGVGDLSLRKLLPSLYFLFRDRKLPRDCNIICVSRGDISNQDFEALIKEKLKEFLKRLFDEQICSEFIKLLSYLKMELNHSSDWEILSKKLSISQNEDRNIIYYMSVPPTLFSIVCEQLKTHKLNPSFASVVVEKPLGEDYQSAFDINELLRKSFKEEQFYRIDHYLGKKAVQDIVKMRFDNNKLKEIWNKDHIEKILITVSETVGVEGRVEFIDRAGILRDMVQNHLMQILSLLMMDMPKIINANVLRDAKVSVVNSLKRITPENIEKNTIKAQYGAGNVNGVSVPSYQEEIKGQAAGNGETFVAIKAYIDSEKWQNVPIILKTGKRLSKRIASIDVIFNEGENKKIHIEIQPDIRFENLTGMDDLIDTVALNKASTDRVPEAYEFLIHQIIKGEQANFVRDDEILASWRWIDGIRDAWQETKREMIEYVAGSDGPEFKNE